MLAPSPTKPAAICVSNTFRTLGVPGAAQDVEVLAAGVHDDLDLGVGEQRRDRRRIGRPLERVDQRGDRVGPAVRDPDRHQAQQRAGSGPRRRTRCRGRCDRPRARGQRAKRAPWGGQASHVAGWTGRESGRGREQPAQASGQGRDVAATSPRATRLTPIRPMNPWIRPGKRRRTTTLPGRRERGRVLLALVAQRVEARGHHQRGRKAGEVGRAQDREAGVGAVSPAPDVVVRRTTPSRSLVRKNPSPNSSLERRRAVASVGRIDEQLRRRRGSSERAASQHATVARLPPALSPPIATAGGVGTELGGVGEAPSQRGARVVDGGGERVLGSEAVVHESTWTPTWRHSMRHAPSWVSRSPITQPPPWR